jgi:hypothetical protein
VTVRPISHFFRRSHKPGATNPANDMRHGICLMRIWRGNRTRRGWSWLVVPQPGWARLGPSLAALMIQTNRNSTSVTASDSSLGMLS